MTKEGHHLTSQPVIQRKVSIWWVCWNWQCKTIYSSCVTHKTFPRLSQSFIFWILSSRAWKPKQNSEQEVPCWKKSFPLPPLHAFLFYGQSLSHPLPLYLIDWVTISLLCPDCVALCIVFSLRALSQFSYKCLRLLNWRFGSVLFSCGSTIPDILLITTSHTRDQCVYQTKKRKNWVVLLTRTI